MSRKRNSHSAFWCALINLTGPYGDIEQPSAVRDAVLGGCRLSIDDFEIRENAGVNQLFPACFKDDPSDRPSFGTIRKDIKKIIIAERKLGSGG